MIRGDLSNRLVHLTRGATPQDAARQFESILRDGALRGSNGYIKGAFNCACFSEAPLSTLTHALAMPPVGGVRYSPFGVIVSKAWLFERGGRPVIYQTDDEYHLLPDAFKFRHVRYDPIRAVDFTWEREWRIRTDLLSLEPNETTFVVPTRKWVRRFHQEHVDAIASATFALDTPVHEPMPWHFVVLQDLGVEGFDDYDF